jgi:hypothetical protein
MYFFKFIFDSLFVSSALDSQFIIHYPESFFYLHFGPISSSYFLYLIFFFCGLSEVTFEIHLAQFIYFNLTFEMYLIDLKSLIIIINPSGQLHFKVQASKHKFMLTMISAMTMIYDYTRAEFGFVL